MKKSLVFLFLILLMSSCNMAPYIKSIGYIDYTMYDNGFFITESNSVSFEYKSLGSISVLILTGYENSKLVKATAQDAVTALVEKAMLKKANGVIALKISPYTDFTTKQNGFFVSGMAIKKLQE